MMLEYAYQDGDVAENVAKKVNKQLLKKIPDSKFESKPYSADEIRILRIGIIGSTIEVPVILTSYLGLRRSEVLGLKWSDIDFQFKVISIRNTVILKGTEIVYRNNTTKTASSTGTLPLLPQLEEYLLAVKKQQEADKELFGSGYQDSDYICRHKDGSLIKPGYVSEVFRKTLKKLGLRPTRFHDLRHSVGTIILEETGDIKLTSEVLRHKTIQTTADLYVQPDTAYKAKGLNKLTDDN